MSESEEDYSVHEDEDDEEEDEGDFEDEDEEEGGAEVENVGGDEDDEGDFENDEVPQKTSSPAKRKAGTGTKSGASESKRSKVEEASKLSTKKSTKTTKRKGKVVADEEGDTTPDGLAPTDSPDAKRENPASSANLTGHQNHNFAAPSSPKQEADSRRKSSTLGSGGSESSQQQEGSSAEKGQEDTNEDEAKKKKKKAAVSKELKNKMRGEDPRAKILHQMYKRNRPGNVASVEGWTGHKIPKGIVQNVLEEMAKSGELKTKDTNGKNKIYWFNQSLFKIKPKDASKLKAEVEDLQTQLGQVQEENTECTKELRRLEATPPDSELEKTVAELEQTRSELSARLTAVRSASVDITPAERQKQRQLFMTYREAWLKRKRQCLDALGTISDAMEKKTKDMMSLVGIETDEDANAAVPPSLGGGFEVNKRPAKIGTKKRR